MYVVDVRQFYAPTGFHQPTIRSQESLLQTCQIWLLAMNPVISTDIRQHCRPRVRTELSQTMGREASAFPPALVVAGLITKTPGIRDNNDNSEFPIHVHAYRAEMLPMWKRHLQISKDAVGSYM